MPQSYLRVGAESRRRFVGRNDLFDSGHSTNSDLGARREGSQQSAACSDAKRPRSDGHDTAEYKAANGSGNRDRKDWLPILFHTHPLSLRSASTRTMESRGRVMLEAQLCRGRLVTFRRRACPAAVTHHTHHVRATPDEATFACLTLLRRPDIERWVY